MNELFNEWCKKLLYPLKFAVLLPVPARNNREVTCVCDLNSNTGKSFFRQHLNNLYNFTLLDGVIITRDLTPFIEGET